MVKSAYLYVNSIMNRSILMPLALLVIAEAALLASALSLDAFTAGFAYGSKKIKIPFLSVTIINIICSSILGVSLTLGSFVSPHLPRWLTLSISFSILFIIGLTKLLDSITKSIIRKHSSFKKEISLSLLNFKFILNLYADPEKADMDDSKSISPAEAAMLALSLSLDGIAIGLGAGMARVNILAVFLWSLVTDALFVMLGSFLGNKAAQKLPFNISWISGLVLMGLALSKLL